MNFSIDRFCRYEDVESSGIKGDGLELKLVKIVVSKMGGKITILDTEHKGVVVVLEMPKLILE